MIKCLANIQYKMKKTKPCNSICDQIRQDYVGKKEEKRGKKSGIFHPM